MQITESIVAQISRKTFNQMFDPALRRSKVLMSGNGSSVNWADNAGHANSANSLTDLSQIESMLADYVSDNELETTLANYATKTYVDQNYLSLSFFNALFQARTSQGATVAPNSGDVSTIDNIKAMFGFWTDQYISALGQGSDGGAITSLAALTDVSLSLPLADGEVLTYSTTLGKWTNGAGVSTAWANITGKPTTIAGYGITDAHITNGVITLGSNSITPITSLSGYATQTWVGNNYLPLSGGTMSGSVYFAPASAAFNSDGIRFKVGDTESVRIGADNGNGLGLYATGTVYIRPNVTLGTASTNGLVISSSAFTYNGYDVVTENSGVALKAAQLNTARTLWGQSFNGTANVDGKMTINHDGSAAELITLKTTNSTYNCISFYKVSDSGYSWSVGVTANGYYFWNEKNSSAHVFDIDNDGNVGIGATSPSYKLHVNGTFYASGNSSIGGTFGVTGATTLTGLLTANGGVVVPSSTTIKIGNAYLSYDSASTALRVSANADGTGAMNFYATGAISALGQGVDGGGGGQGDVSWSALASNNDTRPIALSHLTTALSGYATQTWVGQNYLPLSGGTMSGGIILPLNTYIFGANETYGAMLQWDGTRTIVGSVGATSTAATHIRSITGHATIGTSTAASYTILDTGNYSALISGRQINVDGTNYTVFSPYTSTISIDTTRVTQTVTGSSNTDKRPILVGASSSSAAEPSFSTTTSSVYAAHRLFMQPSTGDLYLYSPSSDSPALYFQRSNSTAYVDWRMYVSGGHFYLQNNGSDGNTWHNTLYLNYNEDKMMFKGKQVLCLDTTYSSYNPAYAKVRSLKIGGLTFDFWSPASTSTVDIDSVIGNYYWADVKISTTSSTTTTPTFYSSYIRGANNEVGSDGNGTNIWFRVGTRYVNFTVSDMAFRRGTGSDSSTITLGTSTYPWAGLYTTSASVTGRLTVNGGVLNVTGESDYAEGIRIHHSSGISSLWFGASSLTGYDAGMWGISVNSNGMRFRGTTSTSGTSPSDYMNILHGGNVGIGTTNPSYKLDVSGYIRSSTAIICTGIEFLSLSSSAGNGGHIDFHYNGSSADYTSRFIEQSSGTVTLHGNFYATGGVTCLSDIRKKDVLSYDLPLTIEQVAEAPTIKFLWKDKREEGEQVGTVAQYWQKVLPEVTKDKSNELSLSYGVTALIAAITTARAVVDHEKRITELERECADWREAYNALRMDYEQLKLKIA